MKICIKYFNENKIVDFWNLEIFLKHSLMVINNNVYKWTHIKLFLKIKPYKSPWFPISVGMNEWYPCINCFSEIICLISQWIVSISIWTFSGVNIHKCMMLQWSLHEIMVWEMLYCVYQNTLKFNTGILNDQCFSNIFKQVKRCQCDSQLAFLLCELYP